MAILNCASIAFSERYKLRVSDLLRTKTESVDSFD